MPSVPIYLRWEHTTPPHHKFYELELELSLFYPKKLTRRWGRIGTRRPRALEVLIHDPDELQDQVQRIRQRRRWHGYHQVAELCTSPVASAAA